MKIEILKKEDIISYKKLIDEAFDGSNSIDYYEKYTGNENYKIVVMKDEDKIVGTLTYYPIELFTFSFQPVLEIFNVAVLKEYRGQKIAKQLFEYVIKYAKENNYKCINLTCLETAKDAHRLYESVGMKKASSIKYAIYL